MTKTSKRCGCLLLGILVSANAFSVEAAKDDWNSSKWTDQQKKQYQKTAELAKNAIRKHNTLLARGEWPSRIPVTDVAWEALGENEKKKQRSIWEEKHSAHISLTKYLADNPTVPAWMGFEHAFHSQKKKDSGHEISWNYTGDWQEGYKKWIAEHPCSVFFHPLFGAGEGLDPTLNLGNNRSDVFNYLMKSPAFDLYDKLELCRLFGLLDWHGSLNAMDAALIQSMDEDLYLDLVGQMIPRTEIVRWEYMTLVEQGLRRGLPDPKNPGEKIAKREDIPLPVANMRFCDFAAVLIKRRYHPEELLREPYDVLMSEAEAAGIRPMFSLKAPKIGDPWPITVWPGWKKMPAMQDAYVAKAKAWLDDYKKKRAAAAALRVLLRNPQAAHLDAKTWQSSWESLVLLEAKATGYNDQRFNLLAEAFLREALHPEAKDRQQRQSCILGQLQQMWMDAKQTLGTPSPDVLTKPGAALDFLESSLKQLTPPLAQDPTAKTLWEYKVKDWRKEWNAKLDVLQKEITSSPSPSK